MGWPSLKTYDRIHPENEEDERREGFEKSYFGMRLLIGLIGVALPALLVIVDWRLLDLPISVRGSMSAYYHSPARDLFVGGLSASGVTLISYMFWKWWTWDFLISFVGGLAVLGVAAFPTARQRNPADHEATLSCDYMQGDIPPCTALQQAWGEGNVRMIHLVVTATVVASFAVLCLVMALRDFGYGLAAHDLAGNDPNRLGPRRIWKRLKAKGSGVPGILRHIWRKAPRTVLYLLCCMGVGTGAAWAARGPDWIVPHGYAGEFVAFTTFGIAWIIASWDLLKRAPLANSVISGVGRTLGIDS